MVIGTQTIEFMTKQIGRMLTEFQDDIAEAYIRSEDGSLSIGLSAKVSAGSDGAKIETGINFVTGRVKDKLVGMISEG